MFITWAWESAKDASTPTRGRQEAIPPQRSRCHKSRTHEHAAKN